MSRAARIASLCFVALVGALRAGPAPAADWLDEMPAVPVVVQAVREQLELNRLNPGAYPAYVGGDADGLASTITGTLVLLRWFMEFESRGEWFMLPARRAERRARMEAIALDYMQVELALGLGVEKHRGRIKTGCDRKDTNLNRLGGKMYPGAECYRVKFRNEVSSIYAAYVYRQSIFPRLFCKSGQAYHERFHKNFTGSGSNFIVTSAGVTRQLPGGQKPLGAALCKPYGGDANGNGLCDEWEKPLLASSGSATCGAPPPPPPPQIELTGLKVLDANRVRVEFTRTGAGGIPSVEFKLARIYRDSGHDISIQVTVESRQSALATTNGASTMPEAVTLRTVDNASLKPDPSHPWLVVRALSGGVQLGPTTKCKQPVPVPPYEQLELDFDNDRTTGLYGPYKTLHEAAKAAEPTARELVEAKSNSWWYPFREVTGYIVRLGLTEQYYITQFVLGPESRGESRSKPWVGDPHWQLSLNRSFRNSCERREEFHPVAIFHSHPTYSCEDNNFFSEDDWKTAYNHRVERDPKWEGDYKGHYLFRPDRCIDFIDGKQSQRNDNKVTRVPATQCSPQANRWFVCKAP